MIFFQNLVFQLNLLALFIFDSMKLEVLFTSSYISSSSYYKWTHERYHKSIMLKKRVKKAFFPEIFLVQRKKWCFLNNQFVLSWSKFDMTSLRTHSSYAMQHKLACFSIYFLPCWKGTYYYEISFTSLYN